MFRNNTFKATKVYLCESVNTCKPIHSALLKCTLH